MMGLMLVVGWVESMSEEQNQQKWAKLAPKYNKHIEDLIWGLFHEVKCPFFDKGKLNPNLIDEFSRDKDAQFLAFEFVEELSTLWQKRFPGKDKPMPKDRHTSESEIKQVRFQQLRDTHSPLSKAQHFELAQNRVKHLTNQTNVPRMTREPVTTESANANQSETSSMSQQPETVINTLEGTQTFANVSNKPAPVDGGTPKDLNPGQVPPATTKPAITPDTKPFFHLPNCKVGTPFSAKIEGSDKSSRQIVVIDLRFPDKFGLTFDPKSQMISGQPLLDGEFDLVLQWVFADAPNEGKSTGICKLTSNPDPRSLWKVIEPAADLPYRKAHIDQKFLKRDRFNLAAASRRGRSHEHEGTFRDDDFFINNDSVSGWTVIIVADGAGSAKNSREGSRIAVETAGNHLTNTFAGEFSSKISGYLSEWDSDQNSQNTIHKEFHYLFHKMATIAIQKIEEEAQQHGVPVKEYSTTLLVAVVKKEGGNTFLATFWMGDGAIAVYGPKSNVRLMGAPDSGEFAGQTRFLDRNALADQGYAKRVRIGRFQNISAVILMTDGVSDPYFETDNGLADPVKWDRLWDEIEPFLSDTAPHERLVEWLHFFKQGHHDDRTLAVFW